MEKSKEISTNFGDMPNLVLVEIFRRLPIATILQCRRVCKPWNSCLSSPHFSNAYRSKSPYPTLIDCNLFPECHLLEFVDEKNYIISPKILRIPPQISTEETRLVGSCNGLVCFLKCSEPFCMCQGVVDIFVGNPILGEYCLISRPKFKNKLDKIKYETYGFGISLNSGHYKVVRILDLENGNQEYTEFQILTVGVDEDWRVLDCKINPIPKHVMKETRHRVLDFTYFSGAIYWLYEDKGKLDSICSFDFSEESVGILSPPPDFKDYKCEKTLAVFKDCLCLVVYDSSHVAVWSMKQYGISESRPKDVSWSIFIGNFTFSFYPIGIWRNGEEMLFRLEKCSFISYNHITKQYKYIRIEDCIRSYDCCVPYSISLLRLEDALKVSKNKDLPLKFFDRPSSMGV